MAKSSRAVSRSISRRRKAARPTVGQDGPELRPKRRRNGPQGSGLLAEEPLLKLPCAVFTCTKLKIDKWKETATRDKVTSVKDSKGADVTDAQLKKQILDAVFTLTGPSTDTPEKRWSKDRTFDTCPPPCKCPADGTTWAQAEDVDQEVEVPVQGGPATAPETYTVTVKLKVTRRIGTAKCV